MRHFFKLCLFVSLHFTLSACSGSGGDQATPSNSDRLNDSGLEASGNVTKGVIKGAFISVYAIDPDSQEPNLAFETISDEQGNFYVDLTGLTVAPPLLVQVTADVNTRMVCDVPMGCLDTLKNFYDFGVSMPLNEDFQLLGALVKSPSSTTLLNAHISPLSHVLVTTAMNLPKGFTKENLERADAWMSQAFGLDYALLDTTAADITKGNQLAENNIDELTHGIYSASFFDLVQSKQWTDSLLTLNNLPVSELRIRASEIAANLINDVSFDAQTLYRIASVTDIEAYLDQANTGPVVIVQPEPQNVSLGKAFSLMVVASGKQSPTYQWYKNDVAIPNATQAILASEHAENSDSGDYRVRVSSGGQTRFSQLATITVVDSAAPLTIVKQPIPQTLTEGQRLSLSVVATGKGPFTYQWQKDGSLIPGATLASYVVDHAELQDAGAYKITVSNESEQLSSLYATTHVISEARKLVISKHPQSQVLAAGMSTELSVTAEGGGYISYQWFRDGKRIIDANTRSLFVSQSGTYLVQLSNSQGSLASNAADIEVIGANVELSILESPQDQNLYLGETLSLSVRAQQAASLSYQWFKNEQKIIQATGTNFLLSNAMLSDSGRYAVKVSNKYGGSRVLKADVQVEAAPSLSLSWSVPSQRENGDVLWLYEIQGYEIEYGNSADKLDRHIKVNGAMQTDYTLTGLDRGLLYLRIATIGIDDVQGRFSPILNVQVD
jgi:hypothetical protein